MTILEAVILGIVQGIFMFFPVSSTSHLVVVQHFLMIPTIFAASAVEFLSLASKGALPSLDWAPLVVGFVVGIFALKVVLRLRYRARFRYFSYYVWALSIVIAIGVSTGHI